MERKTIDLERKSIDLERKSINVEGNQLIWKELSQTTISKVDSLIFLESLDGESTLELI